MKQFFCASLLFLAATFSQATLFTSSPSIFVSSYKWNEHKKREMAWKVLLEAYSGSGIHLHELALTMERETGRPVPISDLSQEIINSYEEAIELCQKAQLDRCEKEGVERIVGDYINDYTEQNFGENF